jgi:hypothetical protein
MASKVFGQYIHQAEYKDKDLNRYITILYFNKEYNVAYDLIDRILGKNPTNAVMLRLRGYTAFELGKFSEGLESMNRFFALRSSSDSEKIIALDYEYHGKLLQKSGSDSLAIISFKKAIELDSTKTALLEDIAKAYEKMKKYSNAVDYIQQYIDSKKGNVSSITYFNLGKDYLILANEAQGTADSLNRMPYLVFADSAFSKVVALSPNSYLGYLWRARVLAGIDPETTQGLAKPDYEKVMVILEEKNDPQKYRTELTEIYRYLGYFYYLQFDAFKKTGTPEEITQAKTDSTNFWQKVLELEPENDTAKQALNALK